MLVGDESWLIFVRTWLKRQNLFGFISEKRRSVYLDGRQDPDEWDDTLLHEVLHAALHKSDCCSHGLIGKWSDNYNQAHRREERLVAKLTPVLLASLKSLGWKPPRFEE